MVRRLVDLGAVLIDLDRAGEARPRLEEAIALSGALGPMVSVSAGDRIDAEIQGFSPIRLRFGDAAEGSG